MDILWHVALVRFRENVPEQKRKEVYDLYQVLASECGGKNAGILRFEVDWNLDLRKNIHLVQIAVFRDDAALQAYRAHPKHIELTNILREIADWLIGDIHRPRGPD